ncbi:MAG TPA: hypothetical protein VG323_03980, partial [Thermoanaerobaculia bacterium]|nr:hypothetical protein [Thermoanaerobaculia bacterium]
ANAVGGREKLAAVKSIYREGTLQVGPYEGRIKVWHTAAGKYRKEEQVGMFSSVETFDGTNVLVQKGGGPAKKLEGAELAIESSKAFANSNAIFFVFFPERHHGSIGADGENAVVFKPEGGVEWRVALDPQTSLPSTMTHKEGDQTITVSFASYETVDGIKLENEIRRSNGEGRPGAVIRFTKTVINAPVEPSLFTIETH